MGTAVADWFMIHPKLNPDMTVAVKESKEKAWLGLEYPETNAVNEETQVSRGKS